MNLKVIEHIRTNNFTDENVMQKITDMWKKAATVIPDKDSNVYRLYHEYESDYRGDYTLSVAVEEKDKPSIVISDHTNYEVFTVNQNDENGIFHTWNDIWYQEEEGQLKRAYTYDFEKYSPNGHIHIYIAVHPK